MACLLYWKVEATDLGELSRNHDIKTEKERCYFARHAQIYCWRSSQWTTFASSAAPAPTSTASRLSLKTRWTCRGRKWTMCWGEPKLLRTHTRHQCSARTCRTAAANAPFSWKSKSGQATSPPPFSTAAASAVTSGRRTDCSLKSL